MDSLASANTQFSLDLFKKLTADHKDKNIFYSPISISSALAMVFLGARGNTATEMAQSLYFPQAGDDIHVGFSKLITELNKPGVPYKLSLANRLYGEKSYTFVEKFLNDTKKHYHAELEPVDFIKSHEQARTNINTWVEKQTKDKIKNLLAEGTLDSLSRLVLVNAIYFKGSWEKKFDESQTKEEPFRLSKNETKPVQMMHQKSKFGFTYIPEIKSQILELPYVGKSLSMFIILPNEIEDNSTGLEKVEKELTYEKLVEWTKPEMLDNAEITVSLPKFKLEETYDLKSVLISMGMVDAFDQTNSDFSGMSPNNELVLSKVVHKSFVEVNEKGTEASAATAVSMMLRCSRIPNYFRAEHPFLFFIKHNRSQNILFYGRFCSP
ncbi:leukocyte elastase inhibitor isoform X2 [Amia ocellicauda]|uniref:leukocyte elastase inhibitor isoform X2 n=1 Tax=Amia ocellicauda TaxID=2972642 RepID=UPI00346467E3